MKKLWTAFLFNRGYCKNQDHLFVDTKPYPNYHVIMGRPAHFFSVFTITIFSLAIYVNTLQNGFVYDDRDTIVNNTLIKDFSNVARLFSKDYFDLSGETTYRPVVTLTYFTDYELYGANPWGYHLTNILLHAANSILLYIFMILLIEQSPQTQDMRPQLLPVWPFLNLPFIVALLFATNPVLTEAVNAISFREDLLAFLFYIATLIVYLLIRSESTFKSCFLSPLAYLISCFTYSLALLSKEMSLTLIVIACCYEWLYKGRVRNLLNWYIIGYIAITCCYIFIRFYYFLSPIAEELPPWSLTERVQTIPWLLMTYLKLSMFPIALSVDHVVFPIKSPYSLPFVVPFIGIILFASLAVIARKTKRALAFGVIFFILSMAPVYNIVRITNPFAERYLYIPAIGIAIAVGSAIQLLSQTQTNKLKSLNLPTFAFFFIIGLYTINVIERNGAWKDAYSLWSDTVRKMPNSSRAHYDLGYCFSQQGNKDEAIKEFKTALKLKPDYHNAALGLGLIYFENGQYLEALKVYQKTLIIFPNDRFARGMLYESLKKISK